MILDCDSDVQDNGIAFIFITGDGFHPIRDGVHIPEDLTQDVQFFCRQRGDFIRRGIIRSRPHRIDGQHIPPVSDHRRIAGIVHIQFIMRILRLDLLDPVSKLSIQCTDSFRHGIACAAVLTREENAEG